MYKSDIVISGVVKTVAHPSLPPKPSKEVIALGFALPPKPLSLSSSPLPRPVKLASSPVSPLVSFAAAVAGKQEAVVIVKEEVVKLAVNDVVVPGIKEEVRDVRGQQGWTVVKRARQVSFSITQYDVIFLRNNPILLSSSSSILKLLSCFAELPPVYLP